MVKVGMRLLTFVATIVLFAASGCGGGGGGTSTGTAADCAADLVCSAPSGVGGDEICISGRVVDGTDLTRVIDASTAGKIEVRLYEPLNFLADPTFPPFKTLTTTNGLLDTCGRFTARFSVSGDTPNGVLAVTTADLVSAGTNSYVLGATLRTVAANMNLATARAYLVSQAQDQALSAAAGLSSGTFASAGSLAVRYHQGGTVSDALPGVPVKGIVPKWNNVTDTVKDYFFSDSSLTTLQTISASQNATGSNGFSLLRTGAGIGNMTAGTECVTSGGAAGVLTVIGPTLTGTTAGAIVFHKIEVNCI